MSIASRVRDLVAGAFPMSTPTTGGDITAPRPSSAYMRGGRGVTFGGWKPALRDAQDDIAMSWDDAAARVADVLHNSGWLSGAVEQAVANTVGNGLRLKPMPENSTFGMSDKDAADWAKMVGRRFELWSRNPQECDVEGLRNFGQMQATAFRSWLATGEVLAELPWRKRPWNQYGTKVRLLPPHRLSRKTDSMRRLINGVFTDTDGMPIAYMATRKDPFLGTQEYIVNARDSMGRPRIIHVYLGTPGTYRGISPMTPCLQVARQFDQLADATLSKAIVQTLFAATVTSDEPSENTFAGLLTPQEQAAIGAQGTTAMGAYMEMIAGYYDSNTLNVGINGRVSHLFPGQKLDLHTSDTPGSDFAEYSKLLLREMMRCLGMTYESGTGDNEKATYSSLQASGAEIHAITRTRRENVVVPFCQPAYEAWLEEEIEAGGIPFPGGIAGFMRHRAAACRAEWRGAPRGHADDLKKAKSHEVWKRLGVMSDEMICNDLGVDVDDVYAQLAAEKALRDQYGIDEPLMMQANGGQPVAADPPDPEDDPEDATDKGA